MIISPNLLHKRCNIGPEKNNGRVVKNSRPRYFQDTNRGIFKTSSGADQVSGKKKPDGGISTSSGTGNGV
jgi:hypothetical protein